MTTAKPLVAFFKDIDKNDLPLVGGKGANLGEMTQSGFPVPNGFAVTVPSYDLFLEENQISEKISEILKATDVNDSQQLDSAAKKVQKIINNSRIPKDVSQEVIKAYKKLSGGVFKKALVAVRSSATAEDLPGASFAGQQATFLNIKGEASVLNAVRECWASLFTARAIFYREQNKIDHAKVKISVMVQLMVQSVVSGVMFSVDPVANDKDRIIIEAVWGLGEMIVQGSVVPDKYVVQKGTFYILSKEVSDQSVQLVRKGSVTKEREVPVKWRTQQKISDEDVIALAKMADKMQNHYYFPQDMEWAWDGKKLFLTQTRPITTLKEKTKVASKKEETDVTAAETPVLQGSAASPGIGTGHVKVLKGPKEIGKVSAGDVLVAKMTSPDYVPAMKKAAAIITDEGGQTSHAAIVSRELGVPCVVGTREATSKLKDGYVVTVNGSKGLVYLGSKVIKEEKKHTKQELERMANLKTATKIYVNLAEPERAREVSKMNVDGVGLLRAEFMIANIGMHPKEAIKQRKQMKFIDALASNLENFCKSFDPRPVVYRATDFKTNEYRALPGGKAWEPEEPNPLMGYRGAFRYVADPEVFHLELEAIKRVREKYHNLALMIPYVRSPEELARVKRLVASAGLFESSSFKFWMMVELPVNVIKLQDFIDVGIDGVSVGSNDLSMLVLGTDRDNAEVAPAYNERAPAVYWSLRRIARICAKNNVKCSICGQAPSSYDDLVEKLVKWGFTSLSVNIDSVARVRGIVHETEKKIIS